MTKEKLEVFKNTVNQVIEDLQHNRHKPIRGYVPVISFKDLDGSSSEFYKMVWAHAKTQCPIKIDVNYNQIRQFDGEFQLEADTKLFDFKAKICYSTELDKYISIENSSKDRFIKYLKEQFI